MLWAPRNGKLNACLLGLAWLAIYAWAVGTSALAETGGLIRLASSTSASDSGLLDVLVPRFEAETGYEIEISSVGTGTALRMGRAGKVDVLIVHAPEAEGKFVEQGYGTARYPLMRNDFIVVGPEGDPAEVGGGREVVELFRRLASRGSLFVSRGDDSGTNKKELEIWERAGIEPVGNDWYLELGSGMGSALKYSSDTGAYTLTDRGTWLALCSEAKLEVMLEGDPELVNYYAVIPVAPGKHPRSNINDKGAETFAKWMTSPETQGDIAAFRVNGEQLFFPAQEAGR